MKKIYFTFIVYNILETNNVLYFNFTKETNFNKRINGEIRNLKSFFIICLHTDGRRQNLKIS